MTSKERGELYGRNQKKTGYGERGKLAIVPYSEKTGYMVLSSRPRLTIELNNSLVKTVYAHTPQAQSACTVFGMNLYPEFFIGSLCPEPLKRGKKRKRAERHHKPVRKIHE